MATQKKMDLKKEFPELYSANPSKPKILEVPTMKYYMIDGQGDPNTSQDYKDAIETLYAALSTMVVNEFYNNLEKGRRIIQARRFGVFID